MTKEQNKIAIKELEGLKEFLENEETQILQNPESKYKKGKLNACYIFLGEVCGRLDNLRQEQKFDEIPDSSSAGTSSELDKLRKENAELKERLEEALTGGCARKPRKNPDAETVKASDTETSEEKPSEEKAEATPSEVPEENKYINYNIDREAWNKRNEENIKRLLELQKNNDVGTEYDDLLFKTSITKWYPFDEIVVLRSGIYAEDAIYKLNTIERLFRDHHIDSLEDLNKLLNFAKITSKEEVNFFKEYVGEGKMEGIEFDVNIGAVLRNPIIETKDFSAEIKWNSIIQIAEVSGLFDRQLEKDRQDKLNSNKEGNDNV